MTWCQRQCAHPAPKSSESSIRQCSYIIDLNTTLHYAHCAPQGRHHLVQNGSYDPCQPEPPANLSNAIMQFLAASCDLDLQHISAYWSTFRSIIWSADVANSNDLQLSALVFYHGANYSYWHAQLMLESGFIVNNMLYPPSHLCLTQGCSNCKKLMEAT